MIFFLGGTLAEFREWSDAQEWPTGTQTHGGSTRDPTGRPLAKFFPYPEALYGWEIYDGDTVEWGRRRPGQMWSDVLCTRDRRTN